MLTLNQFTGILKTLSDAHAQIRSFGEGNPWEIGASQPVSYPLLWVNPLPSGASQKILNLKFRLIFADIVFADKSNEQEVLSDTLQTALDILAQLNNPAYSDDFVPDPNALLTPFTEKFDDDVAGWNVDIQIRVNYLSDRCAVPSSLIVSDNMPLCPPVMVKNTNGSFTATFDSGAAAILPDIQFTDSDGAISAVPAQNNVVAKNIGQMSSQFIEDNLGMIARNSLNTIYGMNTGQTTSYASGDDGDLQKGRLVDFFTLKTNNLFGNTDRFTDENGNQTYSSNYLIDHATGLGWHTVLHSAGSWTTALSTTLSLTVGSNVYSDFYLPNVNEVMSITTWSQVCLNYAPFNLNPGSASQIWTSTTNYSNISTAVRVSIQTIPGASTGLKIGNQPFLLCRVHF